MVTVFYDEHARVDDIRNETIAVVGYGIQGTAQAQNLREQIHRAMKG